MCPTVTEVSAAFRIMSTAYNDSQCEQAYVSQLMAWKAGWIYGWKSCWTALRNTDRNISVVSMNSVSGEAYIDLASSSVGASQVGDAQYVDEYVARKEAFAAGSTVGYEDASNIYYTGNTVDGFPCVFLRVLMQNSCKI